MLTWVAVGVAVVSLAVLAPAALAAWRAAASLGTTTARTVEAWAAAAPARQERSTYGGPVRTDQQEEDVP